MLLIFLFGLWIALCGRITAETLLFGVLAAGWVWALSLRMLDILFRKDFRLLLRLPRLASFLLLLWKEMMVSAFRVMRRIWSPARPSSGTAEFIPEVTTAAGRILLADSITLTPGTITVEAEKGRFLVHCLAGTDAPSVPSVSLVRSIRHLEDSKP